MGLKMETINQTTAVQPPASVPVAPTVYAAPKADTVSYVPPAAPSVTPRTITEGETVEGRLSKILSTGSPLITEARQGAVETAAARGLQNTTIAAGAGERAAIQSALPIAQQDAQTYSTAGQSSQEANQLIATEGYRGGISSALANQQGQQASALSAQEADQKIKLEQIAQQLTGDRQDKETYVNLASGVQQEYQTKYLAIQQTPDTVMNTDAKTLALDTLNRSTKSQMDMLDAVYRVNTTWSGGLTPGGGTPAQGTPTATSAPAAVSSSSPTASSPAVGAASPKPWEEPPMVKTPVTSYGMTPSDKSSDSYFTFDSAMRPGLPGNPGNAPPDPQIEKAYQGIMTAINNPNSPDAQAAAISAIRAAQQPAMPVHMQSVRPGAVLPYTDFSQIPPSSRQPWMEWVNKYVYGGQPAQVDNEGNPILPAALQVEGVEKPNPDNFLEKLIAPGSGLWK